MCKDKGINDFEGYALTRVRVTGGLKEHIVLNQWLAYHPDGGSAMWQDKFDAGCIADTMAKESLLLQTKGEMVNEGDDTVRIVLISLNVEDVTQHFKHGFPFKGQNHQGQSNPEEGKQLSLGVDEDLFRVALAKAEMDRIVHQLIADQTQHEQEQIAEILRTKVNPRIRGRIRRWKLAIRGITIGKEGSVVQESLVVYQRGKEIGRIKTGVYINSVIYGSDDV